MTRPLVDQAQPPDPADTVPGALPARRHGTPLPPPVAPLLRPSPSPVRQRSRRAACSAPPLGALAGAACHRPSLPRHRVRRPPAPSPEPYPGAWSKLSATPCALSVSSLPTSSSSASPPRWRSSPSSTRPWIPPAVGTLLSTAVRFLPLSLAEARRIYDIQRCRGLRLRPWAPQSCLPVIVPLFVSQMCRAHDTSVMLVVRRIATVTRGASPCKVRPRRTWSFSDSPSPPASPILL